MRNKLQNPVAFIKYFYARNFQTHKSKSLKNKFLNENPIVILLFVLFLIISNKGFTQNNESFDSGLPASWTLFGNGVGTSSWSATTDGYLGTNGVSLNPSADNIGDQNTAKYFLVSPQIVVPENGEIQFYTKQASAIDNGAQYEVRVSTAAQPDINGFNVLLQSYTEVNLNEGLQTDYEKKVVELTGIPQGLNIYVAFVVVNTQNGATPTGDELFIDAFDVLEGCTEVVDNTVTIDNISVDSAQVSWSHPSATNFEIQILPTGGTPAANGIPVTGTNYTLSNLDPDTEFDIYISALCDNDTQSAFTGPYTFETLKYGLSCAFPIEVPDITTTPYVLTDNLQNWVNPDEVYTTEGSNCNTTGSTTANYLNGDKVFLSYTPTVDGLLSLTTTTAVDGGANGNNCYNDQTSLFVYNSCADVGVNCLAGTNTTNAFEPKSISNFLVQGGQTYIIVLSSELSSGSGICFELELTSPTCAPPNNITYNSLTENSVTFNWDNIGGFSDSWEYAVVPTGSGEPSGAGTATNTNLNNLINSGLTPATTYDLYVRSVCSGTPGIWSNPSTFTTQCTTFDLPYSTDFASATNTNPEPCWTTIDANGDGSTWGFIGGYATVQTQFSQNENHDIYTSPRVNFDGTPKRIRYKHRATQGSSTYTIKLSTTGIGLDDFTTVVLPETTINNTGFQEVIVDLPLNITGEVNIAWIVEPNASESAIRFSIDDVFIEDKPTCPDPTNPFVLQITTNSAWLFWTAGDAETQWELAIQDFESGTPTTNGTLVTSNFPYMATGLSSGHRYEFYVRAYCAANDQSEWVGPIAFTTLCESYDTPFYESFNDDDSDTQKFCWDITDANNDGATWSIDEDHAYLQTSAISPPSGFNDYLISPAINMDGIKELKYKYRSDFSFFSGTPRFGLEVLMSTTNTNPGSFSVISPFEVFTNPEYTEKSIIVEATGTVYFAFRVPPEFSGSWSILSLDDVSITDAPLCPNPSNLMVNTVSTTSADLSWTAGYQETDWNVVVQQAGTGIPTGTGVAVTSTNYTPTDLLPDTEYEFYVMANCSSDQSQWVGPMSFRTSCLAFTTPFVETFNTNSNSENCWRIINDNDDNETWNMNISGPFPYEGDQTAAIFSGSNGQNEDWLISPTITITDNQRLRYYYRVNDSFFTEDLEVLLSTNGIGLDQFTTVLYDSDDDPVLINNVEYKVKIINFPDGITGDVNIAFHVPFYPSTSTYRGQTLVIDNVNIEDIPECPEPTNITLNNITDTQVQVSWDANGAETDWEISVQPAGTDAPVGNTDPSYLIDASTNPFTVTGLDPSTMYDIYVRAVCDGNTGAWTGPEEVTTKCSFENLCQYTIVLHSDSNISGELELTQNNQLVQVLPFEGIDGDSFTVFLCSGAEFSLFFDTLGYNATQYENYYFEIFDASSNLVYTSPTSLTPRTTVYEGTSVCGAVSCPQPTNLTVSNTSVFSWTPGGSETQWEVAVQSIENGTIPQSGTLVSTNSYTPSASDFNDPFASTYEYFVRAVCGTDDESYWSGPFAFVRNDDVSNAVTLPINTNEVCNTSGTEVSFLNATISPEAMSCSGNNLKDVWFDFTAESLIHTIELNNFNGNLRDSAGDPLYPEITMTLYKDNGAGNLQELNCSYDNVITAMYSSELIVGENYKVRVTLNTVENTEYRFNICIKTPEDLCLVNAVNGSFEDPVLNSLSGVNTIISVNTIPGWRSNLDSSNDILYWDALNAPGFESYEGGQCAQLLSDQSVTVDPNDLTDPKGYYRDFDTSEITLLDYSFAYLKRFDGNIIQLLAGPPGGPYTLVDQPIGNTQLWLVISGQYNVPVGQNQTRFIFRSVGDNSVGNVIDAVNFLPNNQIITESFTLDCDNINANVEANGTGTWLASETNPGTVTITDANSNTTSITDFLQPGVYTFTWQTSYCSYDIEITYNGIADTPTVISPIDYCLNDTAEQLTASASSTYSLIWHTQAVGGTGTTTAPTPDTSVANTTSYYVAYVDSEGCEGPRAEIIVNVSDSFTPELTFSYTDTCAVETVNPTPTLTSGFATGGVFTSTTLTVNATTGEIDMTSATAGQHDVTYTYDGNSDTCTLSGTYTASINFTAATTPTTSFDYGTEPFCILASNSVIPNLVSGFTTGGNFSSSTLTVNSATGEVDLSSATAGTHDITYTFNGDATTCTGPGVFTTSIVITASTTPVTAFTYLNDVYCAESINAVPELDNGFTTGGVFSAETGLAINTTTGEINIAASSVGNYTVVYEILEDINTCVEGSTSEFDITILEDIAVSIEATCNDNDYILTATPLSNSYNTDEATYTWMDSENNVIGQDSDVFNVTTYSNQNQNTTTPVEIYLTVNFGGCTTTTSFTVNQLACDDMEIPKGISPDGNGKNDTFDLTDFGATNVTIFNRHGREVFKYSGLYTNQWKGQNKNGHELPDGTYFYSIQKNDGKSVTGWVFINRAH